MPKRSPGSRRPDDINTRFGSRLRALRENADRSQTDVGHALRVSFQQVQKYENGTTSISLDRLDELAQYFGTSIAHILSGLGEYGSTGFQESDQAGYDADGSGVPPVTLMSKETLTLIEAFNKIRDRKHRRLLLALIESTSNQLKGDSDDSSRTGS